MESNEFVKSSFSSGNSNCLEMKRQGAVVIMRDSVTPETTILTSVADARAFVEGAKNGDFDNLLA